MPAAHDDLQVRAVLLGLGDDVHDVAHVQRGGAEPQHVGLEAVQATLEVLGPVLAMEREVHGRGVMVGALVDVGGQVRLAYIKDRNVAGQVGVDDLDPHC